MPSSETVGRFMIRGLIGAFTAVVMLLFQSAFWTNAVSPSMRAVLIGTALVSAYRPHVGLLLLVAFTPLGRLISHLLGSQIRCAEALVLAYLAGVLLRGWTLHRFRSFPSDRVHLAALVFGFIIAASCIEQLWLLQLQRNFPGPFLLELLGYAAKHYLTSYRGFGVISSAMLLLEGMALLLYGMHYCATQSGYSSRLLRIVLAVTVGLAVLNVSFFANELMDTGDPGGRFVEFLTTQRFSAHIGDVNAAGSFFAMVLVVAFGLALIQAHHRTILGLAGVTILAALWLTSSRTAIFSVVLIGMAAAVRVAIARSRKPVLAGLLTISVLAALSLFTLRVLPQHFFDSTAARAGNIRWMFLVTTARMLEAYPVFGLGIGQYARWSGRFSSPELVAIYPRENAHNNFAQIAGELGIVGLIAFLLMLYFLLRTPGPRASAEIPRFVGPVLAGVAAFLLTCLGGHPLLIPEVGYGFWVTLAIVPGILHVRHRLQSTSVALAGLSVIILLASIGPRIYYKMPLLDWSRVTYGLSNDRFISSRARLFVPAVAAYVTLPFRARAASPENPVEIDVRVDDELVETISITDRGWQSTQLVVPGGKASEFHRIDLEIRHSGDAVPRSRGVELGARRIIAKPNG